MRKRVNLGIISVVVFFLIWEGLSVFNIISPIYIGTPHLLILEFFKLFSDKRFWSQLLNSGQAFVVGYLLALIFGSLAGLVLGINKRLYQVFAPFVFLFNAIPYVAILPLLIIWLGLGVAAKTVIVFLMVSSPVLIYILDSTKTADVQIIKMAKSFGASRVFIIKNVLFYHTLPSIFSAARVGVGRGLTAILVAEIFGLGKGIAYYIPYYGATFQTNKLLATVLFIMLINLLLLNTIKRLRKRVIYWENVTEEIVNG